MANRTVQILGQGYGSNPAQITVTANGTTVFSGAVNTVDQPLPALPNLAINLSEILCTFQIDQAFTGQIPMTCAVSSGTVIFAQIYCNYVSIPNPVYTPEQIATLNNPTTTQADRVAVYTQVAVPPLSQTDIDTLLDPTSTPAQVNAILVAHNCLTYISSGADGYGPIDNTDARSSVTIDGIAQTPDHGDLPGTWWWQINTGSTLAYQLDVDPATV
jgi:hypothetical protein